MSQNIFFASILDGYNLQKTIYQVSNWGAKKN